MAIKRSHKDLKRSRATRTPRDRVLIVSEGKETEPSYFTDIRRELRLSTTQIAVMSCRGGTQSTPIQVVDYAKRLLEDGDTQKHIQKQAFEQVYAVFDRDDHESYFNALRQAESLNRELRKEHKQLVTFKAIPSVPCFELWLLLHFEEVLAPKHRDEIQVMLKRHISNYTKSMKGLFAMTQKHQKDAAAWAQKLAKKASAHDGKEPYTAVHELVQLLIAMKT
jgi:activator of HSP90 ATPase